MGSAASQLFPSSSSFFSNSAVGGEDGRNWEELPRDVMVTILMKLDPREVLKSMQLVCKSWYEISKDPAVWKKFEIRGQFYSFCENKNLIYNAIRRSRGLFLEISLEDVCYNWLLLHIAERSTHLRCLRIRSCESMSDVLFEAVKKLPLLEEAEFTLCQLNCTMIRSVGKCCPNLVSFKLNEKGSKTPDAFYEEEANQKALAIAETMPSIHHLQLIGSRMTNIGLQAILNNCHCLQSLDLRACFQVDLSGNLGKICVNKVKNVKGPYDSTSDYGFEAIDYSDIGCEADGYYDPSDGYYDPSDGDDNLDRIYNSLPFEVRELMISQFMKHEPLVASASIDAYCA